MTLHAPRSIALVRHGETDWNINRRLQGRTDIPLNATGQAQARAAAELLREYRGHDGSDPHELPWRSMVTSPLGRAVETAAIITGLLGLGEASIDEALIERRFGEAEGLLVADAQSRWPQLEVPGAETTSAVAARSAQAFARLLNEAPGTIAVAHGAMLRLGLIELCKVEIPRVLNAEVWLLTESADGPPVARSLGVAHPAV